MAGYSDHISLHIRVPRSVKRALIVQARKEGLNFSILTRRILFIAAAQYNEQDNKGHHIQKELL